MERGSEDSREAAPRMNMSGVDDKMANTRLDLYLLHDVVGSWVKSLVQHIFLERVSSQDSTRNQYRSLVPLPVESCELTLYILKMETEKKSCPYNELTQATF